MSTNNNAQTQSLADIQYKFFSIPAYQRLYTWEREHIEALLNDMLKAHTEPEKEDSEKNYFIGNIVVSKEGNKFELIDGQQRLTTLFLIGFYLAKNCQDSNKWKNFILDKDKDKLRISMPCREIEQDALKDLAKGIARPQNEKNQKGYFQKLINEMPAETHEKIKKALEHIRAWFEGAESGESRFQNDEEIKSFAEFIYNDVKFVFVELAEGTDLNRFFVRMNNRGKQLEKHEILKARLLDKIRKPNDAGKENPEWHIYAKIWDLCSDMNKYIFQSADDRKIFEKQEGNDNNDSKHDLYSIVESNIKTKSASKDDDTPEKYKSIVDFPTLLLHVFKIFKNNNVPIDKNKLLDIINIEKDEAGIAKCFIQHLLFYRVLFDYFVIKEQIGADGKERYKIRKLAKYKNNGNIYFKIATKKESNSESDIDTYPNLSMIQNYLRVARAGDSRNHHHWLTPFLKYLGGILQNELNILENKEVNIQNISLIVIENIAEQSNLDQKDLVKFLEDLDTALACVQYKNDKNRFSEGNEKLPYFDLLKTTNEVLQECNQKKMDSIMQDKNKLLDEYKNLENIQWEFLDKGTGSPHYWFYRLEYYLWKWRNERDKLKFTTENNMLPKISTDLDDLKKKAEKFYFRNLNSVEHVSAQNNEDSTQQMDEEILNSFGNLALLSIGENSSFSNQKYGKKQIDFNQKAESGMILGLKLALIYQNEKWDSELVIKQHGEHMLQILKKSFEN